MTRQHVFTSVILELFWTGDDASVACDTNSFVAGFSCSVGPSDVVLAQPRNRAGHISHSLLMGTINIPDTGEGAMPDLSRVRLYHLHFIVMLLIFASESLYHPESGTPKGTEFSLMNGVVVLWVADNFSSAEHSGNCQCWCSKHWWYW